MDSLLRQLDLLKGISEKGISFQCYYSLKEVTYFYKNALNKVRARLKNPISAKFDEFYISKYKPENNSYVNITLGRQLALYGTMYSPLQMAAYLPETYNKHLDAFQFIKHVSIDCVESQVPEAEPGDYITYARKEKGKENWFYGRTNNEENRTFEIRFDFLTPGKKYLATQYSDATDAHYKTNPKASEIRKYVVMNKSKLRQNCAPGGGYTISIIESKNRSDI